jgi:hypothetical protein
MWFGHVFDVYEGDDWIGGVMQGKQNPRWSAVTPSGASAESLPFATREEGACWLDAQGVRVPKTKKWRYSPPIYAVLGPVEPAMGNNGSATPSIASRTIVASQDAIERDAGEPEDPDIVDDRWEAAGEELQHALRIFQRRTWEDPYAIFLAITVGAALAPAAIAGGIAGRREDATAKGVAVGLGAAAATALLMNPVSVLITGRRNAIPQAIMHIGGGYTPFVLALLASAGVGYGASFLATRDTETP